MIGIKVGVNLNYNEIYRGKKFRGKDMGGLYNIAAGYALRPVFLSITRSYIKAALSFFRTLLPLEYSKRLFLGYNFMVA